MLVALCCAAAAAAAGRCVGILSMDVAPTAPEAVITSHTLRTLAGLAAVDAARREMEKQRQLLADIVKWVQPVLLLQLRWLAAQKDSALGALHGACGVCFCRPVSVAPLPLMSALATALEWHACTAGIGRRPRS